VTIPGSGETVRTLPTILNNTIYTHSTTIYNNNSSISSWPHVADDVTKRQGQSLPPSSSVSPRARSEMTISLVPRRKRSKILLISLPPTSLPLKLLSDSGPHLVLPAIKRAVAIASVPLPSIAVLD
jgi:hypothetical protein